ncbi:hypothetical protein BDN67DRAFT_1003061 [Paxillus ammoniavirescens]|nr:hypothetical protein BDN67DRAFT_1003061 [Paxillus ammoniavirescens]
MAQVHATWEVGACYDYSHQSSYGLASTRETHEGHQGPQRRNQYLSLTSVSRHKTYWKPLNLRTIVPITDEYRTLADSATFTRRPSRFWGHDIHGGPAPSHHENEGNGPSHWSWTESQWSSADTVSAGLGQILAAFYVNILVGDKEYKTASNPARVDGGMTKWQDYIYLPSDPLSMVELHIYVSFELGPMLGRGELLQKFSIGIGELLNHCNVSRPICFVPEECEVVTLCPSLEATVELLSPQDTNMIIFCAPVSAKSDEARAVAEAMDMGHVHMRRYYKDADELHINNAITQFHRALDRCPINHPTRSAALSNLALAKFISSQARGTHRDLDVPIFLFKDALDLRPHDHPDHPSTMLKLAIALSSRFNKRGDATDADEANQLLANVLDICLPDSHEYTLAELVTPMLATDTGANAMGDPSTAVAVSSARSGDRRSPYLLDQLHRDLEQCKQQDDPRQLDNVISQLCSALSFYGPAQPEWIEWTENLTIALGLRFERQGRKQDLEDMLLFSREMLVWTSRRRSHHCRSLKHLASVLMKQFRQDGDRKDLEEGIQLGRDALALTPPGHPDRAVSLRNLGIDLSTRFEQGGDRDDLDEAIQLYHDALVLRPPGHPDHATSLCNLATELGTRFKQSGDRDNLDEAIQLDQDALVLTPPGHPHHAMSLSNLGAKLSTRFEESGDEDDLDKAIQLHRDVLVLRPPGHSNRAMSLSKFAVELGTRFEQSGDRDDLDKAIQLHRDALVLTPLGHPHHAMLLSNLGARLNTQFKQSGDRDVLDEAIQLNHHATSLCNLGAKLFTQFDQTGDRNHLDEAIQLDRDALVFTPLGHPNYAGLLCNLGAKLGTQFEQNGDRDDLDEAIQLDRDALVLRPPGHPDHAISLSNLAVDLSRQFEQGGDRDDLDEAIQLHQDALMLRPPGHSDHAISLCNLGVDLGTQFKQSGDGDDLDEAIQFHRDALVLRPPGHPEHALSLSHLGSELGMRFKQRGNGNDLDEGLQFCTIAKTANSPTHPFQVDVLGTCADMHMHLYHTQHHEDHLNNAISYFNAATAVASGNILLRLTHSLSWIEHAEAHKHSSALDAYATSLQLLDSHLSTTASVSARHQARLNFPAHLSVDAASSSSELQAQKYRNLVDEWNKVVSEIRTIKGFLWFLLPPLFKDLQEASFHIHLKTTLDTLTMLTNQFRREIFNLKEEQPIFTRDYQQERSSPSETTEKLSAVLAETLGALHLHPNREISNGMIKVLRGLWATVASPVVVELEKVGQYRKDGTNLDHLYVSSYTPSLSTLIKAHQKRDSSSPGPVSAHFAAIAQAKPARHQTALSYPDDETDMIGHLLCPSHPTVFTQLTSATSTTDAALDALQKNQWIHFSCHGSQNFKEPFKSSLEMLNGPLSLLDIMNSELSNHEFVYLSASQTAVGDIKTPDEMIHLAAGLQFGGVKSVIGTQWSVHDGVTYLLASEFYKEFCVDGVMDCTRAARALHQALQSLKRQKIPLRE